MLFEGDIDCVERLPVPAERVLKAGRMFTARHTTEG